MKNDNAGFVIEPRTIVTHEWYTDPLTMHLLRHCRQKANYEAKTWRGITIERGQFVTSLKKLSTETGMSVMQVRTALEKLERTGYVTSKATNKYRVISCIFYDSEQNGNRQPNKRPSKQATRKSSTKQQTSNNQITTTNNNISNDILSTNQTSVCAPSAHTQQENKPPSPPAPEGRAASDVTYQEIRQFQIENHIGSGEIVDDFYDAFHESNTRFPENWQQVYTRFARADYPEQDEFVRRLKSGDYHSKWGKVDAGA